MQRVVIDRLLKAAELEVLFSVYYRPRPRDDLYRAVRTGNKTNRLCGWASIEHESYADIEAAVDGRSNNADTASTVEVDVIHISSTQLLYDDFVMGYWLPWHRAFNVLFVRHTRDNMYERLGMGVLFGKEVDVAFKANGLQEITLI